jgi:hypothetical protein
MLTDILNVLVGMLLLFFVPGYALVLALFPKKGLDRYERISIAVVSSITINILPVFAINYVLGTPVNYYTVVASSLLISLLCAVIYFLRARKMPEFYYEIHEYGLQKFLRAFCVLALLAVNFLLVYSIHQDYSYPYLLDEWQHVAEGIQVQDNAGIVLHNPYYKNGGTEGGAGLFERGFRVFLAEFFMLTGQEPARIYAILPAVFAAATGLIVFTFAYKTTGNYATGLFAILFYAALRSNVSVLGPWFFVPMTMGFAYIYAILYLFSAGLERYSIRLLTLSSVFLLTLALIHPLSAAVVFPAMILYVILRPGILKEKNAKLMAGIMLLPFLLSVCIFNAAWQETMEKTLSYSANYFINGTTTQITETASPFFIISFYGMVPLTLALLGAYYAAKKKGPERIFPAWAAVIAAEIILFQITGKTLLAPYERILYYAFLSYVPLSAIGFYALTEYINKKTGNMKLRFASSLLCIGALTCLLFTPYHESRPGLYKIIDDDTYSGIKALGETGTRRIVLARPEISPAVYPISGDYVVAINPAHLGADKKALEDNRRFFMTDCDGKSRVLEKYGADYVFTRREDAQDCPGLKLIYREKGSYIYEVEKKDGL